MALRLGRSALILALAGALLARPHALLAQDPQHPPAAPPDKPPPPAERPTTDRVDQIRQYLRDKGLLELLTGDGLYLQFVGLTPGGGLRAGAGYRGTLPHWRYDTVGMVSIKRYKAFQSGAWWRPLGTDALEIGAHLHYRDFTEERFFGVGLASRADEETNYRISAVQPFGSIAARPRRGLEIGARIGPRTDHLGPGAGSGHPSIEQRFAESAVPGLGRDIRYVSSAVYAQLDRRDRPNHPPIGGTYAITIERYADRDGGRYSTSRLVGEVSQDVPLAGPAHVVVLHALAAGARAGAGGRVPFYLLPVIGGGSTLRGFHSWRFRDRRALVFNVEYRYQARPFLELAAFADYGTVAPSWREVRASRMKPSYGIGVRGRTERRVLVRLDVATGGGEGWHAALQFGPPF